MNVCMWDSRRRRRLGALAAALACLAVAAPIADGDAAPLRKSGDIAPLLGAARLHPTFRSVALGRLGSADEVWASGHYVLAHSSGSNAPLTSAALVIDESTGKRVLFSRPNCNTWGPPLEPPWLLLACPGGAALFGLASGAWHNVALDAEVRADIPLEVGADWLELGRPCQLHPNCTVAVGFQNLLTKEVVSVNDPRLRDWRRGGTTAIDLDSPSLTRPLCAPLRVPLNHDVEHGRLPGELTFYGDYAIAESTAGDGTTRRFLERCGTHLHMQVAPGTDEWAASARAIVWSSYVGSGDLRGVMLPSLRRFEIQVPPAIGDGGWLALSARRLYVLGNGLWAAPAP